MTRIRQFEIQNQKTYGKGIPYPFSEIFFGGARPCPHPICKSWIRHCIW